MIRLRNIRKDDVDHADKHTVLLRVSGVLDDRNHVWSLLGHGDQLTTWSVRELDGVDQTFWADDIGDMRHGGTGRSTEVEHLGARLDEYLVKTTHDTGSELRSERVPDTIFDLGGWDARVLGRLLDSHSLFTVNRLSWRNILGHKQVLLASGNIDTVVSVGFDNNLGATASTASGTASATSWSTSTASGTASWGASAAAPGETASTTTSGETSSTTTSR